MLAAVLIATALGAASSSPEPTEVLTTPAEYTGSGETPAEESIPGVFGNCKMYIDNANNAKFETIICQNYNHMPSNKTNGTHSFLSNSVSPFWNTDDCPAGLPLTGTGVNSCYCQTHANCQPPSEGCCNNVCNTDPCPSYEFDQYTDPTSWGFYTLENLHGPGDDHHNSEVGYISENPNPLLPGFRRSTVRNLWLSGHPFVLSTSNLHQQDRVGTSSSKLKHVPDYAFNGCPFTNTRRLEMSNMEITSIGEYAFAGLPEVRSINLDFNDISFVNPKAFKSVTKLVNVQLQYNLITYLAPTTFEDQTNLQGVFLRANKIEQINLHFFVQEKSLHGFSFKFQEPFSSAEGYRSLAAQHAADPLSADASALVANCALNHDESRDVCCVAQTAAFTGYDCIDWYPTPSNQPFFTYSEQLSTQWPYCDVNKNALTGDPIWESHFDLQRVTLTSQAIDQAAKYVGRIHMDRWNHSLTNHVPSSCNLDPCPDHALACPLKSSTEAASSDMLSTGAIIGISVGGAVGLALTIFLSVKYC